MGFRRSLYKEREENLSTNDSFGASGYKGDTPQRNSSCFCHHGTQLRYRYGSHPDPYISERNAVLIVDLMGWQAPSPHCQAAFCSLQQLLNPTADSCLLSGASATSHHLSSVLCKFFSAFLVCHFFFSCCFSILFDV